ncbi:hypothetical protein MAP00_002276 [Monascus purpureus]|nr:hypothetical protein MAP00_002276 [Monascus purpureus]
MPGTVAEGPGASLSFANNFWGKDDAGVIPMLERMHNSKVTCDELKSFYSTRAAIEDEYSRKLLALCRKPFGSCESGSLRASLDVVRGETESMAKAHAAIASQMKRELEEPLVAFAGGLKERRKIVQGGIERLLKTKIQQTQAVNKTRDRYEQDCLRIKGYLAQGHMVMGQEERKNKAKLEKTQIQLASNSHEYETAVKILEETTGRWNREWKAACDKFQDLEEERLDFTKSSLWTYANISSTVCVSDDASCEKIRLSLEDCEVEKDIAYFIKERGTGSDIPDPPKFIDFTRGDVTDSSSEISEEDGPFSAAQFQRAINSGLRSSSPQPSTYESHHDPQSELAARMGHGSPSTAPSSREATVTPQKPAKQPLPPPSYENEIRTAPHPSVSGRENVATSQKQSKQPPLDVHGAAQHTQSQPPDQAAEVGMVSRSAAPVKEAPIAAPKTTTRQPPPLDLRRGGQLPPNYDPSQHGEIAAIPHNAYPADGMTMFCRTGPPSERSSATSAYRPSSRDSQSACSNRTSLSSQEPVSARHSPTKTTNVAPQPDAGTEKQVQKRRSAFFSNSPFRRKSRHEKDRQPATSRAPSRNTWDSSSKQTTPIKAPRPRRPTVNDDAASGTVEPADPRANFQLNVGNNVFDVASPDAETTKKASQSTKSANDELDPIARALADLKGAGKQSSTRVSADRYHGIATPVPPPVASSTAAATPPPAYNDSSIKRLDAPQPAFTAAQMQKTTQKYIGQAQSMFRSANDGSTSRLATRNNGPTQEVPRSRSPIPRRSASPQVAPRSETRMSQYSGAASPTQGSYQSNSVRSRYSQPPSPAIAPQRTSDVAYSSHDYSRRNSPKVASRAVSPQPQFRQQARPSSAGGMELQLSNQVDMYGGSFDGYAARGRQSSGRPMSSYYGADGVAQGTRARSRTLAVADPGRQYSRDGRPILHFGKFLCLVFFIRWPNEAAVHFLLT